MLCKSKKIISMPIINLQNGCQVGRARTLLIDPEKRTIAGLILDQKGWSREIRIVPFSKINTIGEHAITVEHAACAERARNLPSINKLLREPTPLIGAQVITEEGTVLGKVNEYVFDTESGLLAFLIISGKQLLDNIFRGSARLEASLIHTIGPDNVISSSGSEKELQFLDGTLQETVKNVHQKSSKLWDSVLKTTKFKGKHSSSSIKTPTEKEVKNNRSISDL